MIEAARLRSIMTIAVPIIAGMLSQNVVNLVDTYMLGSLGDNALAAVGIASFANFMTSAPIMGLSVGVQAMAARRVGEGSHDKVALPLNGGLLIAVAFGVPWILSIALGARYWFPALTSSEEVARVGLPYLYCRLAATLLVGINFSFRGFWNATGRSTFYMSTLVFMHVLNVFFNWLLIYGNWGAPKLGVLGAGLSNALATAAGTTLYFALALRKARHQGFLRGIPTAETLRTMLRLSLPNSIQQLFFATGMTTLMWILGRSGTTAVAASKVLLDLVLVALLPAMGFGLAGTTLVSQALGRADAQDAKRWGFDVAKTAFVVVTLIALPAAVFPDFVLTRFLHNEETLALARIPLRVIALTMGLDAVGMVMQSALLGAGDSRRVMTVSLIMQWALFLPIAAVLVLVLGFGMLPVWVLQACYRGIMASIFLTMWQRERWLGIRM